VCDCCGLAGAAEPGASVTGAGAAGEVPGHGALVGTETSHPCLLIAPIFWLCLSALRNPKPTLSGFFVNPQAGSGMLILQ